ncbi:MAG: hypothetical protein IKB77_01440 [Lentisphaeria bacterium]|nr:hypothetical protein [Lentisphaeria bacterium]
MEKEFLTARLIEKFSELTETEIPAEAPAKEELCDRCARLYFDGIECEKHSLRRTYKYRLRYYAEDWDFSLGGILKAEAYLRNSKTEIFSNGENQFFVRYFNINTIHEHLYTASGVMHCFSEIQFSVTL